MKLLLFSVCLCMYVPHFDKSLGMVDLNLIEKNGAKGISEVENGHFVYLLQCWLDVWNSVQFSLFGVFSIGDTIDQKFEAFSLGWLVALESEIELKSLSGAISSGFWSILFKKSQSYCMESMFPLPITTVPPLRVFSFISTGSRPLQ